MSPGRDMKSGPLEARSRSNHLIYLRVAERTLLKCILNCYHTREWNRFIWPRARINVPMLQTSASCTTENSPSAEKLSATEAELCSTDSVTSQPADHMLTNICRREMFLTQTVGLHVITYHCVSTRFFE